MPGRRTLLESLILEYVNKKNAPTIIWTLVALASALYFWLTWRPQKSSRSSDGGDDGKGAGRRDRKISVALDGTLLACEESGVSGAVNDVAVGPFLELCAGSQVFVIALAQDDAREDEVRQALEAIGAFDAGLRRHRLMFSSTADGRASMVRQLQPAVHYEASQSVAEHLEGKVPQVRFVSSPLDWVEQLSGTVSM